MKKKRGTSVLLKEKRRKEKGRSSLLQEEMK